MVKVGVREKLCCVLQTASRELILHLTPGRQCRTFWLIEIIRTRIYKRKASKLLSEAETVTAENEIAAAPEKWPVISGTGGIRKARAARGASGKSGGVRIMYYWLIDEALYLLNIYAKNEKENLSAAEKKVLKEIIKGLMGDSYD